jgi:hypothetical protein
MKTKNQRLFLERKMVKTKQESKLGTKLDGNSQFLATLIVLAILSLTLISASSVDLATPLNNSFITNNSNINFSYSITGDFSLQNTSVFIYFVNGTFYSFQDRIYLPFPLGSGTNQDNLSFEFSPFPIGNYTWYSNLYDFNNNSVYSENRTFEIYKQNIVIPFNPLDSDIYLMFNAVGAGLAIFFQVMSGTLGILLMYIALIAIVIKIFREMRIEDYFRTK